ncbi:acyl-CoA thioesterase domain-containing protein [Gordonia hydrophobica]|uniref:Thioesterase family protein n=1 Tax=Gordonia hydrophobica TaxID=40516 RepID=A0ABZ2U5Y3_9ACTN|nr:acyl-CoA thioesterase domain-containing protein [Gordonia hydrophobica]MBM7365562.1 hypothetical protein [Gordonia hydrophobica]
MPAKTFFTVGEPGRYDPTDFAMSMWGPDSLNGPAVCGVAAAAAEKAGHREGFTPARFTLDLFKNARRLPTVPTTRILREGRRIRVVEVSVTQYDGDSEILAARGTVVFLKNGTNPPGGRWSRPAEANTFRPPADSADTDLPYFRTDRTEWSRSMDDCQNADRLSLWSKPIPVADGEELTPFQRAVIAAESTSLVTNVGDGGIGFINCDLTVALTRLPVGNRIGVESDSHVEDAGLSVGTATLHDECGQFGIGLVTAIDNTHAMIDFSTVTPPSFRAAERS